MSSCCCSLAGTAACKTCSNNPFAETPPTVRTYAVSVTDPVLIAGQKTNADHIRSMTDEDLAICLANLASCPDCYARREGCGINCWEAWLDWLKEEGE